MARARRTHVDCRFAIVVDDREKAPYHFTSVRDDRSRLPVVVRLHTMRLATGDYSILGHESRIAIERKSLTDLFGTVSPKSEGGAHRERFVRELERLNDLEFGAVAVEASIARIWFNPPEQSDLSPKSVVRSIMSWQVKYPRVQWIMSESRAWSELYVYRLLEKFHHYKIIGDGHGLEDVATGDPGPPGHPN